MHHNNQTQTSDITSRANTPIQHNYTLRNIRGRQRHRSINNRLEAIPPLTRTPRRRPQIPLLRLSQIPSSTVFHTIHTPRQLIQHDHTSNSQITPRCLSEPRFINPFRTNNRTHIRTPNRTIPLNILRYRNRPIQRNTRHARRTHPRLLRTPADHLRCNFLRMTSPIQITLSPHLFTLNTQSLPTTPSHMTSAILPSQPFASAITPYDRPRMTQLDDSTLDIEEAIRHSPDSPNSTTSIPPFSFNDIQQHVYQIQEQFRTLLTEQQALHQQQQTTLQAELHQQHTDTLTRQTSLHQQELQHTLSQSHTQSQEQAARYNTLQTEYNTNKEHTEQLQNQIHHLEVQNKSLQERYTTLHTQYTALQEPNTTVQTQEERYTTLYNQHITLQETNTNLQTQYTTTQQEYASLQTKYNDLNTLHNTIQTQYTTSHTQYTTLQRQHNDLQQRYTLIQEQFNSLKETYNTLQRQVNTLKRELQSQSYTARIDQENRQRIHQRTIQSLTAEHINEVDTLKKRIDTLLTQIQQLQTPSTNTPSNDIAMAPTQPPATPPLYTPPSPPRRNETPQPSFFRSDTTNNTPTIQDMNDLIDTRIQTLQHQLDRRLDQHFSERFDPLMHILEHIQQDMRHNNNQARPDTTHIPSTSSRTHTAQPNNRNDSTPINIADLDNTTNKPFTKQDIDTFLNIPNDRITEQETHAFLDRIDNHLSKDPLNAESNSEARALRKLIPHTRWQRLAEWAKIYINSDVPLSYSRLLYWRKRLDESAVRCYPTTVSSNLDNKFNMKRIAEALDGIQKAYTTNNRNTMGNRTTTPFPQPNTNSFTRPPFNTNIRQNNTFNNNNTQNRFNQSDRYQSTNNRPNNNFTSNTNNNPPQRNFATNPNNFTQRNVINDNARQNTPNNNTPNLQQNRFQNRDNNNNRNNERNPQRQTNQNNNERQKPFPQRYMNAQQIEEQSDDEQQYDQDEPLENHPHDTEEQSEDEQPDFL